jgi:hypothetical protein
MGEMSMETMGEDDGFDTKCGGFFK